jgi:L-lactate dehydrogenase complex protein LldG
MQADLLARFIEHAEAAASIVHRMASWDGVAELALDLAGDGPVLLPPSLARAEPTLVTGLAGRFVVANPPDTPAATAGVTQGILGVAETGSVMMAEHDLADRWVSMFAPTLVQVVARGAIVVSLDDVTDRLEAESEPGYRVLITGPSRTADIERLLTIGVQGPSNLHVVVLG